MSTIQQDQLDALLHERLGCSFTEFQKRLFTYAFERGLTEGYRLGKSDGRLAAKGEKRTTAKPGRRPLMPGSLQVLMVDHVNKRGSGMSIEQAIDEFLKIMTAGHKELYKEAPDQKDEFKLPSKAQAKQVYFRAKKKGEKQLSPLGMNRDDALRLRISELGRKPAKF
jgi:hypothetical protein